MIFRKPTERELQVFADRINDQYGPIAVAGFWLLFRRFPAQVAVPMSVILGASVLQHLHMYPDMREVIYEYAEQAVSVVSDITGGMTYWNTAIENLVVTMGGFELPGEVAETMSGKSGSTFGPQTLWEVFSGMQSTVSGIVKGLKNGSIRGKFLQSGPHSESKYNYKAAGRIPLRDLVRRGVSFNKKDCPTLTFHHQNDQVQKTFDLGKTTWSFPENYFLSCESNIDDYKNKFSYTQDNIDNLDPSGNGVNLDSLTCVRMDWIKTQTKIMNTSVHPIEVWLYDWEAKVDMNPSTLTEAAILNQFISWYDLSNSNAASSTWGASNTMEVWNGAEATLKYNWRWLQSFRVCNTTFVRLEPGQVHVHTTFKRVNMTDSNFRQGWTFGEYSTNFNVQRNRTHGVLLRVRGDYGFVNSAGSTATSVAVGTLTRTGGTFSITQDSWFKMTQSVVNSEHIKGQRLSAAQIALRAVTAHNEYVTRYTEEDVVGEVGRNAPDENADDT